jgi:hypothetical protein
MSPANVAEETPPELLPSPTDPVELEQARRRREQYDRNFAWFQEHVVELGLSRFGRTVCVAGQQVFDADTAVEALSAARKAHPDDTGAFVYYFPAHRLPRVYAHPR